MHRERFPIAPARGNIHRVFENASEGDESFKRHIRERRKKVVSKRDGIVGSMCYQCEVGVKDTQCCRDQTISFFGSYVVDHWIEQVFSEGIRTQVCRQRFEIHDAILRQNEVQRRILSDDNPSLEGELMVSDLMIGFAPHHQSFLLCWLSPGVSGSWTPHSTTLRESRGILGASSTRCSFMRP